MCVCVYVDAGLHHGNALSHTISNMSSTTTSPSFSQIQTESPEAREARGVLGLTAKLVHQLTVKEVKAAYKKQALKHHPVSSARR